MGEPTVLLYCTVDADVFEESKDYKYRETIILEEKMLFTILSLKFCSDCANKQ